MKFTDSHCHLDFAELQRDFDSLLSQCYASNIHRLIVPAVSPDNWEKVLTSCSKTQAGCQLFPCLGIHPWYLQGLNSTHLEQLTTKVQQHQDSIIAIGETGIDGVIANEQNNLSQQQLFFEHHINLAQQFNKPLIVHHRRSHQAVIEILKHTQYTRGGIIHAFSGSFQQGKTYIDMGFKLGIGGTITYPRAEKTIKAIKRLPLDALVLETDAPAMPLFGYQGQHNSPLRLMNVFNSLCAIREESAFEIAQQIEQTIDKLFNLSN